VGAIGRIRPAVVKTDGAMGRRSRGTGGGAVVRSLYNRDNPVALAALQRRESMNQCEHQESE